MMRFTASQAFPCRSGIGEPHTTVIGTECAYVPPGPRMICATCIPLLVVDAPAPAPGTDLCDCGGQRHWTAPQGDEGPWVHDKCGRPGFVREKDTGAVLTPLGKLAAEVADRGNHVEIEQTAPGTVETVGAPVQDGAVPEPTPPTADVVQNMIERSPGGTAYVGPPVEGATAIVCPPPAKRGRPKKVLAPGLIVEKLPGADKWCIVHEITQMPLIVGIASKAKTVEPLTRLGQSRIEWTELLTDSGTGMPAAPIAEFLANEQMRLINMAAYREEIFRGYARSADPDSGPGVTPGIAGAGIPAAEGTGGQGSEGRRGTEDEDQGGIATPVPGSDVGDPHVTEHADPAEDGGARGPADQEQGTAGGAPGILGTVVGENSSMVPDSILNGVRLGSGGETTAPRGDGTPAPTGGVSFDGYAVPVGEGTALAGLTADGPHPDVAGYGPDPRTETRDGHRVVWPAGGVGHAPGGAVDQQAPAFTGSANGYGQVSSAAAQSASATAGSSGSFPGTVIDSTKPSLAAFFAGTKSVALAGNTQWAVKTAAELREYVTDYVNNTDRSLQTHLGPSEIGTPCDRQVVGKLVGFPTTNHVTDPWPSFIGTAGHAAMEKVFQRVNEKLHRVRYHTERKVTPHPDHPGTSDLFDEDEFAVLDHKFLGASGMAHLRSPQGPPTKYRIQLLLYALGYRKLGYRVDRVAIIGWPRTDSSVDGMYVWDQPAAPLDDELLQQLFARMAWRQDIAARIRRGEMYLAQVPAVPDEDDCYFCPFYRPQSAKDGGPGCPGHAAN